MHVLLVYDISSDRQRTKIANVCQDYGLDRIQMSAFAGLLNRNYQEELMLKLQNILGKEDGTIQLYPIDETSWEKRLEIANAGQ
ncbi:MAG: CRISPR-associated endonuclease Cas2 [Aggregatilineales bacterium]